MTFNLGRLVEDEDLEHGWICERCGQPFQAGDFAIPTEYAVSYEAALIESTWLCEWCVVE
jgi:hypothetical protein